ncbi:hypothetical protein BCV69DRAFT_285154 [Microstroma glucosiphilum]|uniref:Pali-domain-containing protein n=1 Tax=Pseudomicrostroma glucosiphilum TaxID=1684307 RepID=A0A316TZC3_9BASI|nr:hypothetical protein BCV69DRAFT_285154 [Pseudomicrostroma glucosiphilum]PWN18532.1 hypothetical protein BCV69DRAFT_285154 [Pseudomicrostroma glucosiphilum]
MINQRWLKTALVAEVPVLIVTLALLSWALYALNDAATFIGMVSISNPYPNKHQAKYGLDLGTQIVTLTTTFTDLTYLYSPVIVYATRTRSVYYQNTSTTVVIRQTSQMFLGTTSGTITATQTSTLWPAYGGTAPYGDIYSQAHVNPSSLKVWSSGEYDAYLSSAGLLPSTVGTPPASVTQSSRTTTTSVPTASATPAPERRDGSWSEGYTYHAMQDGLYNDDADNEYFLPLWLGAFAACLAVIVLRLIVNVAYVCMTPRKPTAVLLLCTAAIAFLVLSACGISAWSYFVLIQHLRAPEVLATFIFYIISTIATVPVLVAGAFELQRYKREARFKPKETIVLQEMTGEQVDRGEVDSANTASDHQPPPAYEK